MASTMASAAASGKAAHLSSTDLSFQENGYLILRSLLSSTDIALLQKWAQEVHDLPRAEDSPWMPYEEVDSTGKRVLCRTENYVDYHEGFNSLLRGEKLLGILDELAGEEMLLFKEKINYKLPNAGGFAPHIDSTAYTHIERIKHLTILLSIDASNLINGGLEVVPGSHLHEIPMDADSNCISRAWVSSQTWVPIELEAGDMLIFGSYLAHRSGPNRSRVKRWAVYATYNCATEGDLHENYYADRKVLWPATHLRREGSDYEEERLRYEFGSPMLSVDEGRQVGF